VAWGTAIISQSSFNRETLLPCYSLNYPRDPQRFAILYLTLAVGALFDPTLPEGAISAWYDGYGITDKADGQTTITHVIS
jgi:hypothetical protein